MTTHNKPFAGRPTLGRSTRKTPPETEGATNAGLIEIEIQYRALEDLILDSRNPRQHSQAQVNQIADSIRDGFVMPVVIDDSGHVVIGHGRVLADGTFAGLRSRIAEQSAADEEADRPLAIEEVIARFYHLHGATEA